MNIIPAINCFDRDCFLEKINLADKFLSDGGWLHLDISDTAFNGLSSYFNEGDIKPFADRLNFEAHLMAERDFLRNFDFATSSVKRFFLHFGVVQKNLEWLEGALKLGKEFGLVFLPNDEINIDLLPKNINLFQILAVIPGLSGQEFNVDALKKINSLKKGRPNVKISVDGGINPQTAKLCKEAGADELVSGSYIWSSENPAEAYNKLKEVA